MTSRRANQSEDLNNPVARKPDALTWALVLALLLPAGASLGQTASRARPFEWQNPIDFAYPFHDGVKERVIRELRDPCIIRAGDVYYLVYTVYPFTHSDRRDADKIDRNSPPGIMLYSSKDLRTWTFENWLVKSSDLPDDCPYKHRFWAPEIHAIKGKFYLIFTADNWIDDAHNKGGKIGAYVAFVGVADKITGPYRNITWLKGAGCDTTLFADDGRTYAIMPFGDVHLQEVDLTGIEKGDIRLIGPRTTIVARDNADVGKTSKPDYLEGPWMIKRGGRYIVFTAAPYGIHNKPSASAPPADLERGYWVGAAVAENIRGPYRKQPQVFLGGHIAVFTGPDGKEWFSYRGESVGTPRGRLCIDPIPFADDGSVKPFSPSIKTMEVPLK